jgi:hypothetical protein
MKNRYVVLSALLMAGFISSEMGCSNNASNPGTPGASLIHFSVAGPNAANAGTSFGIAVTILDQNNNVYPGYTGNVHFTSTDPFASLPSLSPLTNGVGAFSVTMKTAGARTISATDSAAANLTGTSNAITVVATTPTHYLVGASNSVTAGNLLPVTVTAVDAYNNLVTTYSGTVTLTSTDPGAALPAPSAISNGVGTYPVTLFTAQPQTIFAAGTGPFSGQTGIITVTAAPVTTFMVAAPTTSTSGLPVTFSVRAVDAYQNLVAGYPGTVHFTSNDAGATLPVDSTLTGGTGSFPATLVNPGTWTITATDAVTLTITGTSNGITE